MMTGVETADHALELAAKMQCPATGCADSVPGAGVAGASRLQLSEPWVLP